MRASHQNSTFQRSVVEDVTAQIKSQEERKQNNLKKLTTLIRRIINLIKEYKDNAVLKYNIEEDKLIIYKIKRKEILPKDLYSKQNNIQDFKADTNIQNNSI